MKNRRVVFTNPWKVEFVVDEFDEKKIPSNQVLVKKLYSLISAGTELACLAGNEAWFKFPKTPGYTNVARVEAVGDSVTSVQPGDLVFQYGGHCEYELVPAGRILIKVPETMDLKLVPFTRLASVAMTAIRASDIELGDHVAVVGQGLVGNMAAQLARLQGAEVTALDLSEGRLELSKKCGIDHIINASAEDVKKRIMEITKDQGVSTLIEATGNAKSTLDGLKLIAKNGEIVLLGTPRAAYEGNLTEVFGYCQKSALGSITFKGAQEWRYPTMKDAFVKHSIERNSEIILDLIAKNKLDVASLISHIIKPEQADVAYEGLKNNINEYVAVVIDWN